MYESQSGFTFQDLVQQLDDNLNLNEEIDLDAPNANPGVVAFPEQVRELLIGEFTCAICQ